MHPFGESKFQKINLIHHRRWRLHFISAQRHCVFPFCVYILLGKILQFSIPLVYLFCCLPFTTTSLSTVHTFSTCNAFCHLNVFSVHVNSAICASVSFLFSLSLSHCLCPICSQGEKNFSSAHLVHPNNFHTITSVSHWRLHNTPCLHLLQTCHSFLVLCTEILAKYVSTPLHWAKVRSNRTRDCWMRWEFVNSVSKLQLTQTNTLAVRKLACCLCCQMQLLTCPTDGRTV